MQRKRQVQINTNLVNKLSAGNKRNNRPQGTVKCSRCGGNHLSRACRLKDARCYNCQQIGHIASACKSGALSRQGKGRIQNLAVDASAADENESQSSEDGLGIFGLYATNSDRVGRGYHVEVAVNGESINMEIDTAADYSIMSSDTYAKKFKAFPLQNTDVQLKTYSGETLRTCGQMLCEVSYNGEEYVLPMIVAESEGKPTLLGGDWLEKLRIDWNKVFSLSQTSGSEELDRILSKYANLFREGYDGMKGIKGHIRVRDGASPIYFKSRPVPYAL